MGDLTLHDDPDLEPALGGLVQRLVHHRFYGEYDDHERAVEAATGCCAAPRAALAPAGPRRLGAERGHVWLGLDGDDLFVRDLQLDDRALAAEVRELIVERARAAGHARVDGRCAADRPGAGGLRPRRRLPRDGPPDAPDRSTTGCPPRTGWCWCRWTRRRTTPYMAHGNETYAQERMLAGESPERARAIAEEQMAELLPDGLHSAGNHFFVGEVDGERVGVLWLSTAADGVRLRRAWSTRTGAARATARA